MPKDFPRARRVADQIQRELPELIRQEVKDPRVGMLTITEVEVNRDMEFAKVYFTTLGGEPEHSACLLGLQRASGFLRTQLSRRMQLRVVPNKFPALRVEGHSLHRCRPLSDSDAGTAATPRGRSGPTPP